VGGVHVTQSTPTDPPACCQILCHIQVAPLQAQLDSVLSSLHDSSTRLEQCQGELSTLDARVGSLKAAFQLSVREAEALRLQVAKAEATLGAATGE
jgi:chromosome segregation ATPase